MQVKNEDVLNRSEMLKIDGLVKDIEIDNLKTYNIIKSSVEFSYWFLQMNHNESLHICVHSPS